MIATFLCLLLGTLIPEGIIYASGLKLAFLSGDKAFAAAVVICCFLGGISQHRNKLGYPLIGYTRDFHAMFGLVICTGLGLVAMGPFNKLAVAIYLLLGVINLFVGAVTFNLIKRLKRNSASNSNFEQMVVTSDQVAHFNFGIPTTAPGAELLCAAEQDNGTFCLFKGLFDHTNAVWILPNGQTLDRKLNDRWTIFQG
jgi:hypothetical protein